MSSPATGEPTACEDVEEDPGIAHASFCAVIWLIVNSTEGMTRRVMTVPTTGPFAFWNSGT